MKIVADAHIPYVKEYFGQCGDLILKPGRAITAADVKDADMLLVRSITHVNSELLSGSAVRFVGSMTAGLDHLDIEWLEAQGIVWASAEGFNAPPVADYVVSVIAALQRKGLLQRKPLKAAIIGVGHVGRLIEQRFKNLGIEVLLCDPFRAKHESDFVSVALHEINDVDLITLHVPLTKKGEHPTYHFLDEAFLKRQKQGAILINASRGAVLNTETFMSAGIFMHGCFDVWENEPNINHALLEQTLIATPHIAGYSIQSKIRGIDMLYQAACRVGMINSQDDHSPVEMPRQKLVFAGGKHRWQDIVLGIFNPLILTAMMRSVILNSKDPHDFDLMRNQFNYRHELGYTEVESEGLSEEDRELLGRLGIKTLS